jgi:hypothetical protein
MNIMLIRSQMPALLHAPPAGQHRVCHRQRQRERALGATRTSSVDGEGITGSCPGGTLNANIAMRVRLVRLESP